MAGRVLLSLAGLVTVLLGSAEPASAHEVSSGSMPAPPWLLGYIGAFAVGATAVVSRAWPRHRLQRFMDPTRRLAPSLHLGHAVGLVLFAAVLVAAVVGPDSAAANIAPVTVFVIWWVGLPLLCLVLGDVMRAINPFLALVAVVGRRDGSNAAGDGPVWTAAGFLGAFAWFFIAYHEPGSPRALAVFLGLYASSPWSAAWCGDAVGWPPARASVPSPPPSPCCPRAGTATGPRPEWRVS